MKFEVKDQGDNVLWETEFELDENVEPKIYYYGGAAGAQTAITPGTTLVSAVLPIVPDDGAADEEEEEVVPEPDPEPESEFGV